MKDLWNRLVEPPAFIDDYVERMWAKFVLASMLLVLAAFSCVVFYIFLFQKPWVYGLEPQTVVVSIAFILNLSNFVMAKGRFHYLSRHFNVLIYAISWYCGLVFSRTEDVFIPLGFIPAHLLIFAVFWPFKIAVRYGIVFVIGTILIIHYFVGWTPSPKPYYYLVAVFFLIVIMSASYLLTLYIKAAHAQNAKIQKSEALRETSDQMTRFYNFSSLGAMTGEIMHEINNPLQNAFSLKEHLKVQIEDSNPELLPTLEGINDAHKKIATAIDNVSRYYRGSINNNFTKTTVKELWESSLYFVEHRIKKHNIPLYYQGLIGRIEVESLEHELSQVLVNLLNNAIDAIVDDPQGWIRVEFHNVDENLLVRVINSGKPLTQLEADRFINTFKTTKPPGMGSGMGLPICKRIIEGRHHGKFGYELFEDMSSFFFSVPLQRTM